MPSKPKATVKEESAKPALVPKMRFPEFRASDGWTEETGNALFDQINDRNRESGLPVLAITQEHGAIPRHMIDYHVSVAEKSIENYKVVKVGDFIISLRSFQGGIEHSRYHGICSPAYVILRLRDGDNNNYFRHYLKTDRFIRILTRNLEGLRDGKMISYAQFSELLLPLPSPAEQQKIAECLSSVDEVIAAQARKVDALKTYKKGLQQQLFPREGETQPRLRFPEFQNAGAWEETSLGSVARLRNGYAFKSAEYVDDGRYQVITIANVQQGNLAMKSTKRIAELPRDIQEHQVLRPGDILISMTGNVGRVCAVTAEDLLLNQRVGKLVPESIEEGFLYQLLQRDRFRNAMQLKAAGGAQGNLSGGDITDFAFRVPTAPDEQNKIASCLSSIDAVIVAEKKVHAALQRHKFGLMQQLFPSPEELEV